MKNLILSLVLLFSISAVAQRQEEEARVALAKGMVSFVESVKPAYVKGMSYEQFQNKLTGGSRPTTEGSELIRKAHEFISRNYSAAAIESNYNGKEVASVYFKLEALKKNKSTANGTDIFASSGNFNPYENKSDNVAGGKCKPWWDIFCQIRQLLAIIEENQAAICVIATMFGLPCIF